VANESKPEKKKISKQSFLNALSVFRYIKPHSFLFTIGILLLVVSGLLVIVITALLGQLVSPDSSAEFTGGAWAHWIPTGAEWGGTSKVLAALVACIFFHM